MKQSNDDNVDVRQLGDYIKRLRARRGLSIRRLAAVVGVDATWLSRLERGEYTSPDPRYLRDLAQVLEVAAADLYILAGYQDDENLPGFAPYLRAKYDLPPDAIEQLAAHFDLINEKYRQDEDGGDAGSDR